MNKKSLLKKVGMMFLATVLLAGCGGKGGKAPAAGGAKKAAVKWPTKNVTVILPYNAGGDTDTYCRLMAKKLGEKYKQNFVVVNMTGGSGIVAAKTVMAAKPDGYNILFNHTGASLVQEATGVADFSYTDGFANVATIAQDNSYVVCVKKTSGWKDLKEFVAYCKANPGKVRFSNVYGSINHYLAAQMEETMGISMDKLDVGTGASERLAAFMGNQVDVYAANFLNVRDYVEKGDFIVLGVCSAKPVPGMEKFKTFTEQGYKIVVSKNYEVKLPKETNQAIIDELANEIKVITADADFKATLAKYYAQPEFRDAATMGKDDKAEVEALKKYFAKK